MAVHALQPSATTASTAVPRAATGRGAWIVSPRLDLSLLVVPAVGTFLALLLPAPVGPLPFWAFMVLVVAFDVAHVWATLYVSYLDRDVFARRRLLLLLPIPIALIASWRLHAFSPVLFWTIVAYIAIHHFAAQQWGFIALYRLRAGERAPLDRHLDRWALWTGALGPILWWHASPERQLDWFGNGETFIFTLDPALKTDIAVVMAVVAGLWTARQVWHLRHGSLNTGKVLWMLAVWLSWAIGIGVPEHPLVSLAAVNLLHGLPFLGLVWFRCNQRWQDRAEGAPSPLLAWLSQRRAILGFYGLVFSLAFAEQMLWDGAVFGTYLPMVLDLEPLDVTTTFGSLVVAVLALPQIIHYYLDRWLWKLDGSNPDLDAALGLPRRA